MTGGYKAENNPQLIAETFKISIVDVFLSSLLLKYTNQKLCVSLSLGIYQV